MSLEHSTINCATEGCYAVITVHPQEERRLRRTGEMFYCAAGHSNYFKTGKSEKQKRIDQLERAEQDQIRERIRVTEQREDLIDVLRHCPVCNITPGRFVRVHRDGQGSYAFHDDLANLRAWMQDHLATEHGVEILVAVEPAE